MKCLTFLLKTIWFSQTNLVSNQKAPTLTKFLSVTHEIYKSFDDGFEVRGAFLDILKVFDKVWHRGIFKLKQNCISGKLSSVLSDFLKDRKQIVVFNGQNSSLTGVNAGVPKG